MESISNQNIYQTLFTFTQIFPSSRKWSLKKESGRICMFCVAILSDLCSHRLFPEMNVIRLSGFGSGIRYLIVS